MSGYSLFLALALLCVQHVKCSDKNESSEFIREKSVEDFKALCPYTDLCYHPARENITRAGNGTLPCCHSCNCDTSCGTACCPDKPERFLNKNEILKLISVPEQCFYAQLRPFSSNKLNGVPFNMNGNCPVDYTNEYVKAKCSRKYHEFNFGQEDTQRLMPVSSEIMNVTFKNYYCAICHNVVNTKLQFWNTKIECANKKKLLLSNISEISLKLSQEPMCQVIFEPSFKTPRNDVKPCSGVIDRCNVTGNWYQYDYALETACMSYTSEYKGFKNIHCFLCNGNTLTNEDSICERESGEHGDTSFVALLDFYDLDGTSSKSKVTKCSSGSKYDPLKKVCRPLSCAPGMMLSQDKCTPIYKEMVNSENDLVFRLQFNLLSTHATKSFQWFHLERLAELVLNEFSSKLILLYTTFSARLCDFNSYVKLEQSLENTVISMKRENLTDFMTFVHHLAIVVDFSFEEIRNTSATLEEMATLFASYDYYAQYLVQYKSGDSEMPTKYNYNASEEFESTLNELDIDMFQYYMILRGQNDPEDGLGILWLEYIFAPQQGCESTLSIQPNPFCACIELNRNEFNIDIANRRIKSGGFSHTSSLELTFSKILSSKNGEGVLVCSDEYFSQLPSESKHFPAVKDQLVVLTIICLVCSIISLLLTFVIYSMLPSLRTLPGLNNMALVFHLFLAHTLALIIAVTDIKVQWLCSAVGVLLHYTLLSSFLWMFICTFHMMTVFAKIKDRHAAVHNNKFFRYLIFTEVISALLIVSNIVVALISSKTSPGFGYGGSNCYIRDSITILLFVAVPLGLILTANFGMFAYVIWIVARLPDMAKHSNHERHNIMIFFKLSTLTGITWIFGFLYEFFDILLFAYAYIVLNAGQGVFIMFSFVLNKRVFFMLRSKSHAKKDGLSAETTRQVHVSVVSYK